MYRAERSAERADESLDRKGPGRSIVTLEVRDSAGSGVSALTFCWPFQVRKVFLRSTGAASEGL